MSKFQLTEPINPNKVFMLSKKEIEKRNDPFYYIPSIAELERKVRLRKPRPLRDFVVSIASGATPKTSEAEKYYSDKENGVPFLRVQNLSPTGFLELDNVKYINKKTHEGILKRSQVSGGDLLVKITGVGRMAVASVAPEGFVGNTNQHMVVIKTANREVSEILAAYLNTDIAEALASRRATGGTRPALDYPSLLSIPIIYDERILEIRKDAIEQKEKFHYESKCLTDSIGDYIFSKLSISFNDYSNEINNRIFDKSSEYTMGNRLDPEYYSKKYQNIISDIEQGAFNLVQLSSITTSLKSGSTPAKSQYSDEITDFPIIKAGSYTNNFIDLKKLDFCTSKQSNRAKKGDIFVLSAAHQSQYVGRHIKFLNEEPSIPTSFVGELICIRCDASLCNPLYLFSLLNTEPFKQLINREKTGQTSHIYGKDLKKIKIPLPKIEIQNEFVIHIENVIDKAQGLIEKGNKIFNESNVNVKHLILGE